MARYRLRFLLQEFDLPPGDTLIGRSPECRITIEDPLVSRQHARVRIEPNQAIFEDLGSRNGSRVNGVVIKGEQALKDGDRLRIGTQELVFCVVATMPAATGKPTGFLRHCAGCHLPYPEEMGSCPNCGSSERRDEETLSGMLGDSKQNWTLQLLVEVLDKAIAVGRDADAERILRRAMANVDERMSAGHPLDGKQLDGLADSMLRVCEKQRSGVWVKWLLDAYRGAELLPPPAIADRIAALPPEEHPGFLPALRDLVTGARARRTLTGDDTLALTRLERLLSELGGA